MAMFTKLSFCQKIRDLASNFFTQMFNVSILYQIVSAKAVVQVDFPAFALSIHEQNALRITKGNNKIGP